MKNRLNKSVLIILSIVLFFLFSYASAQKEQIESMDAAAYNNRGLTYMKKGQYDRAIPDFSKAIEMDSRYARAYYNRGITYGKNDQYDRAISDFTKAIEIDPKYAPMCQHISKDRGKHPSRLFSGSRWQAGPSCMMPLPMQGAPFST